MNRFFSTSAMLAIAASTTLITSCSHDKDMYDPNANLAAYEQAWTEQFGAIDSAQTWNTSQTVTVDVTSAMAGTIKLYTASPIGNAIAPLITQSITAGGTISLVVAKPQSAEKLYVVYYDADNFLIEQTITPTVGSKTNVTFGSNAVSATAKVKTRAIASNWTFSEIEDGCVTEIPGDAQQYNYDTCNDESYTNYKVSTSTSKIKSNKTGKNFYFDSGNYNINITNIQDDFYFASNTNIYLLNGANLTLNMYDNGQSGVKIYISEGATLTVNGTIHTNNLIYNKGAITANAISCYNGAWDSSLGRNVTTTVLYNLGTVNVSGEINLNNSHVEIINLNKLKAGTVYVSGTGHFYNVSGGEATVGTTKIDCNNGTWRNDGQYTSTYFNYDGGYSDDVINNCMLTVTEKMYLRCNGKFQLDGNAGVVTKDFELQYGNIELGSNSIFKVENEAYMHVHQINYGFKGVGDNYAVLQATKITNDPSNRDQSVTYSGNLIVACDSHFDNTVGWNPYYLYDNAKMAKGQNEAGITIPSSQCSPGYGTNEGGGEEGTMYYYYAFEDLGTIGDYDFNDIVLRASAPVDGKSTIELCAAGGTMEAYVYYNSEALGSEVHAAFGAETSTMVNTGAGPSASFVKLGEVEVPAGTDVSNLNLSISVTANGTSQTLTPSTQTGKVPLMIKVCGDSKDGKWYWSKETVNISTSYTEFGAWGANYNSNTSWYETPTAGNVFEY